MIAFGHTAIGTLVGIGTYQLLGDVNPILGTTTALGAGIVSHYITDVIPHGHLIRFKDYKKKVHLVIIFDLALSILLFSSLAYVIHGFSWQTLYILAGIAGAQLPDVMDGLIYVGFLPNKGIIKLENDFHSGTHWHGTFDKALMWGKRDIWQVSAVLIALIATIIY